MAGGCGEIWSIMKDQVVETPSQQVAEASATELLNHSFFNDFDMQILQLQIVIVWLCLDQDWMKGRLQ